VKVCGLTRIGDVEAACAAGVDLVGLVQVERSKRFVTLDQSIELADAARGRAQLVLLFMDSDERTVAHAVESLAPDVLQFHGGESPSFCRQFGLPWIKALACHGQSSDVIRQQGAYYADAHYLLLDGHAPGEMGGSGQRVGDEQIGLDLPAPVMLAGGLSAENVEQMLQRWRPAAVDVSSGVESAPGEKASGKVIEFLRAVVNTAAKC
jgi:phosphoribosylanthranilate isomerase